MTRFLLASLLTVASFLAPTTAAPALAQPPSRSTDLTIPITGSGPAATFTGTFTLQRFVVTEDGIAAVGRLVGTLTSTADNTVTSIVRTVTLPVEIGQATCAILHLELGPLSLDLLGLHVDLSRIVLDITAEPGPGNLLGNLLCRVAALLDNPNGLAQLLNQILAALR